mgnify:CR=1 FL=1
MASITIKGLTKSFTGDAKQAAVSDLNLDIKDNQFITLLGPSGCGKTTTLRMIAGYIVPDAGTIHVGERWNTTSRSTIGWIAGTAPARVKLTTGVKFAPRRLMRVAIGSVADHRRKGNLAVSDAVVPHRATVVSAACLGRSAEAPSWCPCSRTTRSSPWCGSRR